VPKLISYFVNRLDVWYSFFVAAICLLSILYVSNHPLFPYVKEERIKDDLYVSLVLNDRVFYQDQYIRIWIYLRNKGNEDTAITSSSGFPTTYISIRSSNGSVIVEFIRWGIRQSPRTWRVKAHWELLLLHKKVRVDKRFPPASYYINTTIIFVSNKYQCKLIAPIEITSESYYPIHALIDVIEMLTPSIVIYITLYALPKIMLSKIASKL